MENILQSDVIAKAFKDRNEKPAERKGRDGDLGDRLEWAIAQHAFLFLKDICHQHQHHPDSADPIVSVHKTPSVTARRWRTATYHDLLRRTLQNRRSGDDRSANDADGMLAYLESFHRMFCDKVKGTPPLPSQQLASIRASIATMQAKQAADKERRQFYMQLTQNLSLFLIAAFALVGQVLQPREDTEDADATFRAIDHLIKNETNIVFGGLITLFLAIPGVIIALHKYPIQSRIAKWWLGNTAIKAGMATLGMILFFVSAVVLFGIIYAFQTDIFPTLFYSIFPNEAVPQ